MGRGCRQAHDAEEGQDLSMGAALQQEEQPAVGCYAGSVHWGGFIWSTL